MDAFYEHTRPIRLRNSGPKFVPCGSKAEGDGWQQVFPSWEDVADWPNVGATPRKGYLIIDIDDKDDKGKKRFTPAQRLGALQYIRRAGGVVSHSHSRTHPDDPLHGHWLVRKPVQVGLSHKHPYGENIIPEKYGVFVRTERRPEPDIRSPWADVAQAVGEIIRDSKKGEHGGLNNLAYEWAAWLGEMGASEADVRPMWKLVPKERRSNLRDTVTRGREKGSDKHKDDQEIGDATEGIKRARDLRRDPPGNPDLFDLVHSKHVTSIAGKPGTFKSWLTLFIAREHLLQGGGVLLIDGDMPEGMVGRRLDTVALGESSCFVRCEGYFWRKGNVNELLTATLEMIGHRPLYTILDSGTSLGSGIDEESWERFKEEVGWSLLKQAGGMLLLEHVGQHNNSRARGTIAKDADVELPLVVRKFTPNVLAGSSSEDRPPVGTMTLKLNGKDRDFIHKGRDTFTIQWTEGMAVVKADVKQDSDADLAKKRKQRKADDETRRALDEEMYAMRKAGASIRKVADEFGCSPGRVQDAERRCKSREAEARLKDIRDGK